MSEVKLTYDQLMKSDSIIKLEIKASTITANLPSRYFGPANQTTNENVLTPGEMTSTNTEMFTRTQNPDYALAPDNQPAEYRLNPNKAKTPKRNLKDFLENLEDLNPKEAAIWDTDQGLDSNVKMETDSANDSAQVGTYPYGWQSKKPNTNQGLVQLLREMVVDPKEEKEEKTAELRVVSLPSSRLPRQVSTDLKPEEMVELDDEAKLQRALDLAKSNIVIESGYDVFKHYVEKNNIDPVTIAQLMIESGSKSEPYLRTILAFVLDFKIWDKVDTRQIIEKLPDNRHGWVVHNDITPSMYSELFTFDPSNFDFELLKDSKYLRSR